MTFLENLLGSTLLSKSSVFGKQETYSEAEIFTPYFLPASANPTMPVTRNVFKRQAFNKSHALNPSGHFRAHLFPCEK